MKGCPSEQVSIVRVCSDCAAGLEVDFRDNSPTTDLPTPVDLDDKKNLPFINPLSIRPDSVSNIIVNCSRQSNKHNPHRRFRNFSEMNSLIKPCKESVKPKDMPAMKGILTLFFCIVYASVLFIMAAVLSRVFSSFTKSANSFGWKIHTWESDTKKQFDVRPNRVYTRWGQ